MSTRRALLVAAGKYEDKTLGQLRAATADVRSLAAVLGDPKIGEFTVEPPLLDKSRQTTERGIHEFCQEAVGDDVILLYFTGHGILGKDGVFYFATKDTSVTRLLSTAIHQDFITAALGESSARTKIVILDCCHSGAFAPGLGRKGSNVFDVSDRFAGYGDIILTASTALEYAFEERVEPNRDQAETRVDALDDSTKFTSVFTNILVEGLASGDADLDEDGVVSIDDIYRYTFDGVRARVPSQSPGRGGTGFGDIRLAYSARGRTIPVELRNALTSSRRSVLREAIEDLYELAASGDDETITVVEAELRTLARSDGHERIAEAANDVLKLLDLPPEEPAGPQSHGVWEPGTAALISRATPSALTQYARAVNAASVLVGRFRSHGHLEARLDPLGSEPEGDPGLDPEPLGLISDVLQAIPRMALNIYVPGETLVDALGHLRGTYCGTIAYEIEHIASHRQRVWLREHIESGAFRTPLTNDESRWLLRRLVKVDALERFMHKAYLGQHQFSIEGLDMTVPMLDELIKLSAAHGGKEVVIGMAHRGRLNVLAHNLGRAYDTIFAEFEGASTLEAVTTIPHGGTGDVSVNHGTQASYSFTEVDTIRVNLESNPSHLEYVYPVVEGATRAAQTTRQGPHAHQDTDAAVPIVIHGDASFPAQGVVSETLNLQALDGYKVGGTVHLITNNQVGFTTDPDDARSTRWASDLSKGFDVPIVHVNADDVQACMSAVRLAFAFRQEFGHDVLIDLIGYRRFGHNESDEPAYTQPEMYAKIKAKKRVSELWAERLVAEGVVSQEEVDTQAQEVWDHLTLLHQRLKAKIAAAAEHGDHATGEYELDRSPAPEIQTAVPAARLRDLGEELLSVPDGFTVHPKLVKRLERRREALGEESHTIDWAHAEALAFASLLTEGTPIRLTGQDTERGTFSQRHMVLHDAKTGQTVCPIQSLPDALAPLELHNSPANNDTTLAFEYGYSQEAPETFVLWEAQFGDFVNSAQVIVDQFIVSGLAKWGQTSRLTLLLPHGYEGSGPEHSSARLERFLALAAEGNIRVASPTTPAQYFHLLRRQARIAKQRPLIVMTPKSLLQATNALADLAEGTRFHPVLAEPGVDDEKVTRLLLCTGKIYYDLVGHPDRASHPGLAVARVELLYPFPEGQLLELIRKYPNLQEVVWVQEEPRNMGARSYMTSRLMQIMPEDIRFGFIGRPERASPGEGYPAAHLAEQNRIVTTAIDLDQAISQYPRKTPGQR